MWSLGWIFWRFGRMWMLYQILLNISIFFGDTENIFFWNFFCILTNDWPIWVGTSVLEYFSEWRYSLEYFSAVSNEISNVKDIQMFSGPEWGRPGLIAVLGLSDLPSHGGPLVICWNFVKREPNCKNCPLLIGFFKVWTKCKPTNATILVVRSVFCAKIGVKCSPLLR